MSAQKRDAVKKTQKGKKREKALKPIKMRYSKKDAKRKPIKMRCGKKDAKKREKAQLAEMR